MRPARSTAWVLTVGGLLGLLAALTLTIERFMLLEDASYVPSCSLNPVLSCGSVMTTDQAALFGFPNPILGIVAFTVVVVTGILTLARIELPHWYWLGLSLGTLLGVVFIHWLIDQSLYEIGALCPYCMAVWAVTVPIFWYVTLRNLHRAGSTPALRQWSDAVLGNHSIPLTVWFLALITLIAQRFWPYWSTLL